MYLYIYIQHIYMYINIYLRMHKCKHIYMQKYNIKYQSDHKHLYMRKSQQIFSIERAIQKEYRLTFEHYDLLKRRGLLQGVDGYSPPSIECFCCPCPDEYLCASLLLL